MPTFLTPLVQPLLEESVKYNSVLKARIALLLGANPNDNLTQPMICRAAAAGQVEMVKALIKGGAKLTAKDADGDTPLLAALRGFEIQTRTSAKKDKSGSRDTIEGRATSKAKAWTPSDGNPAKKVADKTTTWVLDDGGNIADKAGLQGQRRLPPTAVGVIEALTAAGANPNATGAGGMTYRQTPLMLAAQWGNVPITKILLQTGADVNAYDSDGETVMMYAAAAGVVDVAKLLIGKGVNVNAQNAAGATALHIAAHYNRAAVASLLLAAGADLSIRNHKGLAATDVAVAMHSIATAKAIVAAVQSGVAIKPGAKPAGS